MPNQDARPAGRVDCLVPARFWWLRRIAVAIGIVILAAVGVRLWWGYEAGRRLGAEIDRYRAAGEPIYPSDFDTPPVPDQENAVVALRQATGALILSYEQHELADRLSDYPQLHPRHWRDTRKIVEASARARALARKARGMPRADWALRMRTPVEPFIVNSLPAERQLAKVLCAASTYAHHTGNDAEAVEALRDVLAVARIMDEYPSRIAHQMSMGRYLNAMLVAETITPDLNIASASRRHDAGVTPATKDQVKALIDDLLDERAFRQAALRAMQSQRMESFDGLGLRIAQQVNLLTAGGRGSGPPATFWNRQFTRVFRPVVELDALRVLKHQTAYIDATRAPTFPAADRIAPRELRPLPPSFGRPFRPFWGGYRRFPVRHHLEWCFMILAMRRMAATALAVRMYELDHGTRPATLGALVSEYLADVPADPYTEDGRKIRCRPDGKRALLYCLNADGGDDDGKHKRLWPRLTAYDLPFYLEKEWLRPPLIGGPGPIPLAETVTDNGEEDRQQRNTPKDQNRP